MSPIKDIMNLSGKVAIVTGGAKGIGYGISYRLAESGAKVLIADMDLATAEKVVEEFKAKGWVAAATPTDVSDEAAVEAMVAQCQEQFGAVDILVNNAGIYPNEPIAAMNQADFERVININLRSVFLTTKHVSETMKAAGKGGKIINISSVDAIHPSMVGLAHYDASKHGVWGFTMNSALELAASKIWVNAVAPGGITTPGTTPKAGSAPVEPKMMEAFMSKIPMRRMGEPDDIGKVVLFLASDLSSYMTGTQIVVDGGVLLS
jgi:2-deoxy-D-gluconate 3-dehydrogenase